MNVLQEIGIEHFYHVSPLHYLPFIVRSKSLRSKDRLIEAGFTAEHFRKTSNKQDILRGFSSCIHSTLNEWPPILGAKLSHGFPHHRFKIPSSCLGAEYDLCRFNIARGRYLLNGASPLPANNRNGKYYGDHQLPVARLPDEQRAMMSELKLTKTTVEVLFRDELALPDNVICQFFSDGDMEAAEKILEQLNSNFVAERVDPQSAYPTSPDHQKSVSEFVAQALAHPEWKGSGLDYDNL